MDKIVIENGDKSEELFGGELFDALKKELSVAKRTDLNVHFSTSVIRVKFYVKDTLVRDMQMGKAGYEQWVKVYDADAEHLLIFSKNKEGLTELTDETYAMLSACLNN